MKRALVLVLAGAALAIGAWQGDVRGQQSADAQTLRDYLTSTDCTNPCILGMEVNVSTKVEVRATAEARGLELRYVMGLPENSDLWFLWLEGDEFTFDDGTMRGEVIITFADDVVIQFIAPLDVPVDTVVDAYGYPDNVWMGGPDTNAIGDRPFQLVYRDLRIVFHVAPYFDPERVGVVTIISRDEGFNILDIPIGEDVTEVSCSLYGFAPCIVPTATPAPARDVIAPALGDSGSVLVYTRRRGEGVEVVRFTDTQQNSFIVPDNTCFSISSDGRRVVASTQRAGELMLFDVDTQQMTDQIPWNPGWELCRIVWWSDTLVSTRQTVDPAMWVDFDVSGGAFSPAEYSAPPSLPRPPLPGWTPDTLNDYSLRSPDGSYYLYERCPNLDFIGTGYERWCRVATEFVIYDVAAETIVYTLENPDSSLIRGYYELDPLRNQLAFENTVWSPDSRFLAFHRTYRGNRFTLRIYDIETERLLNTEWLDVPIDSYSAFQWSPLGNRLAFWIVGRGGEPEPGDNEDILRSLLFYHTDNERFVLADESINARRGYGYLGTWSPDGNWFTYIDNTGVMFQANANDGSTGILDEDVIEIVAWRLD